MERAYAEHRCSARCRRRWWHGLCSAGLLIASGCVTSTDLGQPVFLRRSEVGTEAQFDPLRSSLQYVLDGAQIGDAGTDHYEDKVEVVWDHLRDPVRTIERADRGWREFVNAEVFPIDADRIGEARAILPNLMLHTLGGGMLCRKYAEWFHAHEVPAPLLAATALSMVTEVLGEATEKPATDDYDEIADVYVFRPLGIWLFADDERARWLRDELHLVDWPYLLMWSLEDERFANTGMNYALRPRWFASDSTCLFAHVGITNVFGLSHRLGGGDSLSWGVGAATVTVEPVELRFSAGAFWDRDDSLLASLIVNGADAYAVRVNVYPGALFGSDVPAAFFGGVDDDGELQFGVQWVLPIGVSR